MIKRVRSRVRTRQHQISVSCWTLFSSMALLVVRLRYSFVLCLPLRRIAILTGYSGTCQNGTCQNGNILDTAKVIRDTLFLGNNRSLIPSFFPSGLGNIKRPGTCKTYRFPFRSQSLRVSSPLPCSWALLVSLRLVDVKLLLTGCPPNTDCCRRRIRKAKAVKFPDIGSPATRAIPSGLGQTPVSAPYAFTGPSATSASSN